MSAHARSANGQPLANSIDANFTTRLYVGDSIRYFFKLPSGSELMVKALNDNQAPVIQPGARTQLTWDTSGGLALDRQA